MEYYVYKHTLFDGRTYIGITRQNPPQKRWQNGTGYKGNTYFTRAIEKYCFYRADPRNNNITKTEHYLLTLPHGYAMAATATSKATSPLQTSIR